MTARALRAAAACAVAFAFAAGPAPAQDLPVRAMLAPRVVKIGEVARWRGEVLVPRAYGREVKFVPPDSSDALQWGRVRASRHPAADGRDTLVVEATLQAFRPGSVIVPGLAFTHPSLPAPHRLPSLGLMVTPVIPATDTTADLKPVRGPLAAPWWERVPWRWVAAGVVVLAVVVWLVRRLRRRRPAAAPAVRPALDPAAAALERLAALRAQRLPESGEFARHAYELTAILRRYLEATLPRLRPGFTTAALAERLRSEGVPADEQATLLALLRVWDRVKFARAPFTPDEARRSEDAVESYVRRRAAAPAPPAGKAA